MSVHTTRRGEDTARCGTDPLPADVVPWADLAAPGERVPTCVGCIEDIRDHARPRWLDEVLFP